MTCRLAAPGGALSTILTGQERLLGGESIGFGLLHRRYARVRDRLSVVRCRVCNRAAALEFRGPGYADSR